VLSARLPPSPAAGIDISSNAALTVTAPKNKAIRGPASIALFASPDALLFDATQVAPSVTRHLNLKAGGSATLRLPGSFFANLPVGTYHLLATVTVPDGTITGAAGPPFTLVKQRPSLLASSVVASPAMISPGAALNLGMTLQNAGNVPAVGTTTMTISLSTSASGAGGSRASAVSLRVKLMSGQSRTYRVRFAVPRGTAAGIYYVAASVNPIAFGDPVAADGFAVSAMPITVT
jgi:hypothetical protein